LENRGFIRMATSFGVGWGAPEWRQTFGQFGLNFHFPGDVCLQKIFSKIFVNFWVLPMCIFPVNLNVVFDITVSRIGVWDF